MVLPGVIVTLVALFLVRATLTRNWALSAALCVVLVVVTDFTTSYALSSRIEVGTMNTFDAGGIRDASKAVGYQGLAGSAA